MLRRVYKAPISKLSASVSTTTTVSTTAASVASIQAALRWANFTVKVPDLGGESVKNAKVASIEVKEGDEVPEDTVLCIVESDKSSVDIRTDKSGVVKSLAVKEGDVIEVGADVAVIDEQKVEKKKKKKSSSSASSEESQKSSSSEPAAEEKATEKKSSSQTESSSSSSGSSSSPAAPSKPAAGSRSTYTKPISTMRNRIAERLKGSQNENALLTTFNEIDCTDLINMRAKYKDAFEKKHKVKLGLMSPFLKASAHALMDVPVINASWGKGVIEYRDFVDISVAVATPKGLVVPVMRNVESMSYADIEKNLQHFADKAKANKITPDDMAGGTFTISNGGTFGSWMGTPIVNPPQSAILGMHAIKKKPWVNEKDEVVVRQIMAVALTYDHRLIDGRDAVTFLVKMKNCIEDPARMLLDLA